MALHGMAWYGMAWYGRYQSVTFRSQEFSVFLGGIGEFPGIFHLSRKKEQVLVKFGTKQGPEKFGTENKYRCWKKIGDCHTLVGMVLYGVQEHCIGLIHHQRFHSSLKSANFRQMSIFASFNN